MRDSLIVLLLAFVLDLYLGDPVYALHPVRLMGRLVRKIECLLERWQYLNRKGGLLLLMLMPSGVIGIYLALDWLLAGYGLLLAVFMVYSSISVQDLIKHGRAVLVALEAQHLDQARNAVQMMIGRDARTLDIYGVTRAAVESLAENFVDGFLAPLFWYTLGVVVAEKIGFDPLTGGVLLILVYRSVNTLDSMVGYKNERYLDFGWASAKCDDVLNFIPARLGIPVLTLAAFICRLNGRKAWSIGWKERLKHNSPNAGHAEATVAGALQIRLNGPGIYPHGKVEKPWLGEGTEQVTPKHLKQAFYLILTAAFLSTAIYAVAMFLI